MSGPSSRLPYQWAFVQVTLEVGLRPGYPMSGPSSRLPYEWAFVQVTLEVGLRPVYPMSGPSSSLPYEWTFVQSIAESTHNAILRGLMVYGEGSSAAEISGILRVDLSRCIHNHGHDEEETLEMVSDGDIVI
ncbi:hypothetical protein RRG08_033617 [Elysia crispata]|uniref:Uncharacterized protein n=1 Tax=Elysia crispata TaxID=231223 RepID=A0AAE0XRQ9_9GAST|nr:hypothetical protein RRG08_033617 [Elysia crispata]